MLSLLDPLCLEKKNQQKTLSETLSQRFINVSIKKWAFTSLQAHTCLEVLADPLK